MTRGRYSPGVIDVFERKRYAVHQAARTDAADLFLSGARLRESKVGRHIKEGIDIRIVGLDYTQTSFGQLHRGDRT